MSTPTQTQITQRHHHRAVRFFWGLLIGATTVSLLGNVFRPMDDAMVANGVVEQSEASDAQRAFEDPSFLYRAGLTVAVWGRKPPA